MVIYIQKICSIIVKITLFEIQTAQDFCWHRRVVPSLKVVKLRSKRLPHQAGSSADKKSRIGFGTMNSAEIMHQINVTFTEIFLLLVHWLKYLPVYCNFLQSNDFPVAIVSACQSSPGSFCSAGPAANFRLDLKR